MGSTVADTVIDALIAEGVERVYGVPGDAVNALLDSIRRRSDRIRFILTRHEENAALIAAYEAKLTGRLAACVGTGGPGGIHLLNGLYEAKMEGVPVLALTGQVALPMIGTDYFQEVNLVRLFQDVAVFNQMLVSPESAGLMVGRAIRAARTERGVAHLNLPEDVARGPSGPSFRLSPIDYAQACAVPSPEQIASAQDRIQKGERIVLLVGKGARAARAEILDLAARLRAPIVKTLHGKDLLPDDHPMALGGVGLLGTRPAQDAMEKADTLLMIGTSYPYTQFLPTDAQVIQIDRAPEQIGKRYPVDLALVGDARATIHSLLAGLPARTDERFLKGCRAAMAHWRDAQAGAESDASTPIRPQRLAREIARAVGPGGIVSVDVGTVTVWMARNFPVSEEQRLLFSGWLATMGSGLPGAMAAQWVHPDRRVAAAVGDGGFAMTLTDFVTAVRYQLPIVVVVFNNGKLAFIQFEEEVEGFPDYGTDLVNADYAAWARACGGVGYTVRDPAQLAPTLEKAFADRRPTVVDVFTRPDERPMPSHLTLSQATGFAKSLLREKFFP
ncbi:MAG: thiamine pyrophosphate-dependent enzyme [Thermoplasmata archaeon]